MISSQATAGVSAERTFLMFGLSGFFCAFSLADIQKIVPMALLSAPPTLPPLFEGFLNWGGKIIPVLCLAKLFHLQENPAELYSHLLILKNKNHLMGLRVDYAHQIISLRQESLLPFASDHSFNHCAEAQTTVAGQTIYLLSAEKLLLEEERRRIEELCILEQERVKLFENGESRP